MSEQGFHNSRSFKTFLFCGGRVAVFRVQDQGDTQSQPKMKFRFQQPIIPFGMGCFAQLKIDFDRPDIEPEQITR